MESLFTELSKLAAERAARSISTVICTCNNESWNEIGIQQGERFVVCASCDPKINCHLCHGTGTRDFVESTIPFYQHETKELMGESQNTKFYSCVCTDIHKTAERFNNAEIPKRYIKSRFNMLEVDHLNAEQKKILHENVDLVKKFCEDLQNKHFVTLFGPVGTGKTLLAVAALKYLIAKQKRAGKFIDFQYLLSLIRNQFEQNQTGEGLIHMYRSVDILVIDEFGKGRMDKEWPLEKLDDIINFRYNHKKITILTTNYLPFQFKYDAKQKPFAYGKSAYIAESPIHESFWDKSLVERIGERMYDRLVEVSEFINFMGLPSYRRYMAKELLSRLSFTNHL